MGLTDNEAFAKLLKSLENFDQLIADNRNPQADLASHYPYSPERYHFYVNGDRKYLLYGSHPKFDDAENYFGLNPDAGDVITFNTTERYRYPVGFVMSISHSERINQALSDGDAVIRGFGKPDLENSSDDTPGPNADGWLWINNSTTTGAEVKLALYNDGEETASDKMEIHTALDVQRRLEERGDWYNVGSVEGVESYTDGGEQINERAVEVGNDDGKATKIGNHKFHMSVKASNSTSNLEVQMGSIALIDLGSTDPIGRGKGSSITLTHSGSGDWEVMGAIKSNSSVVNSQITFVDIGKVSDNSQDVKVLGSVVDKENTDVVDGDFFTPEDRSPRNTTIRIAEFVGGNKTLPNQIASDAETVVSEPAVADPGGWQVARATLWSSGSGANTTVKSDSFVRPRNIPEGEYILMLGKIGGGSQVTLEVDFDTTEQY